MPTVYLWDWSLVNNEGARNECFVAAHLLKAVHFWTDCGYGEYSLHYVRDKAGREVDFLVVRNGTPWFLVEAKSSAAKGPTPGLKHFHATLGTSHAFQVAVNAPYVDSDCFEQTRPVIVPTSTFLSQLV